MRAPARFVLVAVLAPAPAFAQGSDDCSTAQPISGLGVFAFDNSTATTDGLPNPLCNAFGATQIANDVWFEWTATLDGFHEISTCLTTNIDSRVAVYEGSCTGPILACNDDLGCAVQSRAGWYATSGSVYLLRVGNYPTTTGGSGDFTISTIPVALNAANGHNYQYVPGYGDWDRAAQIASSVSHQGDPGHLVTISDSLEDAFVYFTLVNGALGNAWLGGYQDLNDPAYVEPSGAWKWVTGEPFAYQNWTVGEPNNSGGAEHYLGYWPADQWNDYQLYDAAILGFVVEYESTAIGTNYCGPAIPNSTGQSAVISADGSTSAALNTVTLTANALPPGEFGYFLTSQSQGFFNPPGSTGLICLSGNIGRYNCSPCGHIIQGPTGSITIDLNAMPVNPPAAVAPGETWYFQCWYRDHIPALTSNFTDGLEILFQ